MDFVPHRGNEIPHLAKIVFLALDSAGDWGLPVGEDDAQDRHEAYRTEDQELLGPGPVVELFAQFGLRLPIVPIELSIAVTPWFRM